MTEQLRQSLSAVIDGEADAFELRRVLDELARDPELRATWERYHLIGSVMRGERTVQSRTATRALSRSVPRAVRESTEREAEAAEPPSVAADLGDGPRRRSRGWLGGALAAGLALAVAWMFQPFATSPTAEGPAVAMASAAQEVGPAVDAQQPASAAGDMAGARVAAADDARFARDGIRPVSQADLRRARAYMLQHAQQQGLEQRGVISLVKMATYEAP